MIKILFVEEVLSERLLIESRIPDYCITITTSEIDKASALSEEIGADLLLIGPTASALWPCCCSEPGIKDKTRCRTVVLSRSPPGEVREPGCNSAEILRIPADLNRLLDILDEIAINRLAEITKSPAYRLNRKMSMLVGSSKHILEVKDSIVKYCSAPGPVLISGESGTGKDIIARLLHDFSGCKDGPFLAVNAGAIPPELSASELFGVVPGAFTGAVRRTGYFEYADGGTLFLDEVAELGVAVQAELLRVIESGSVRRVGANDYQSVSVRLITATNADLSAAVQEGRFRSDLLYRINMFRIHIAPLRERKEDIPDLLMHFSEQLRLERPNRHWEFTDSFLDKLFEYNWPGNVRELRNVFRRAVYSADGEVLTADSIKYDY